MICSINFNWPPFFLADTEVIDLETLVAKNNAYWTKALEAWERRDAMKIEAEKDKVRASADRDWHMLKLEKRKIRILEMEAKMKYRQNEMKIWQAELEEVRKRIAFVQQPKDLGQTPEDINRFLGEQFAWGEGTSCTEVDRSLMTDNEDSSEDDSDS